MKDTITSHQAVDSEVEKSRTNHEEFAGYNDPHRAALEDNPEHAEKLTWPIVLSALFLGTSFTGPIIFGFILVQLSEKIGGETIDFWIPSGWGAAAATVSAATLPDLMEAVGLTLVGVPRQAATVPDVSASVFDRCVTAARYGYAYGFRITWLASIPFGVLALVCAVMVRDPSKYFTNHVEIHLNKKIGGTYEGAEGKDEHVAKEI